jgi:hypothetical protein
MPYYRIGGMMAHIRMDRRQAKKAAPPCPFWLYAPGEAGKRGERMRCMQMAHYLCDFPGCNAPFCEQHRLNLGPEIDVCPTHNARRGLFSRLLPAPTGADA